MMDRYLELWAAYRTGGLDAFLVHCAPDLVVEEYAGVPGAQTWQGHDGMREMWRRWEEGFDGFEFEPVGEPQQLTESAFARGVRVHGVGRGSGVVVDWDLVMVSVLRDGLCVHQFLVDTMEEARARVS